MSASNHSKWSLKSLIDRNLAQLTWRSYSCSRHTKLPSMKFMNDHDSFIISSLRCARELVDDCRDGRARSIGRLVSGLLSRGLKIVELSREPIRWSCWAPTPNNSSKRAEILFCLSVRRLAGRLRRSARRGSCAGSCRNLTEVHVKRDEDNRGAGEQARDCLQFKQATSSNDIPSHGACASLTRLGGAIRSV